MGGPSVAVLLPADWVSADVAEFQSWLSLLMTADEYGGWVLRAPARLGMGAAAGTPAQVRIDVGEWECADDDEVEAVTRAAGFHPATEIVMMAAVNHPADHELLGRLAAATARRYDGIIDMTGLLPAVEPALGGRCHEIAYEEGSYHVVDADFLDVWIRHPRFRMVK